MVNLPSSTKFAGKAVGLIKLPEGLPPSRLEEAIQQQESDFRRFCERHFFQPVATFSESPDIGEQRSNGDQTIEDTSSYGQSAYYRMRRFMSEDGAVSAAAMLEAEALADQQAERALLLLELESLGAKVYLFNGQTVDSSTILMGARPSLTRPSIYVSEKIKAGMRSRAIKGEGLGKPPYGYRIGERRKLEIVPEEAENVRLIYSMYTQDDKGIRLIVRHLNEKAIHTRKGRKWSMVTIRDILRNRAYLGTYTRFGMRVPGSHPPIITPEVFRWTQSRLEERHPSRRSVQAVPFLLSGLIYCGLCDNRMMGVTRRQSWMRQRDGSSTEKEYRYYQCQSRTNQGVCKYNTQDSAILEAKVLDYLREQRARLSTKPRRSAQAVLAAVQREQRRLEAARGSIDTKLRRGIKQILAGKLSFVRFRPKSTELLRERRNLLDRLDVLATAGPAEGLGRSPAELAVQTIDELLTSGDSLTFSRKQDLIASLVDRIQVDEERPEITLRPDLGP